MQANIAPLPVVAGIGPVRARLPQDAKPRPALEFVTYLIDTQARRHPEDDAAAILARFAAGEVVTRRGPLQPEDLVNPGEDVWFYKRPAPEPPVPYEITQLAEDDGLLVVDKPPFLATMPRGRHITETVTVRLRKATGNGELSPAHRLDRLTSGVLVLTKRRELRGAYQQLFAQKQAQKQYAAIVSPLPQRPEVLPPAELRFSGFGELPLPGTLWENHLVKKDGELQSRVLPLPPNASTTVLRVEELGATETAQLNQMHATCHPVLYRLHLQPHTGKTHQLRVHCWLAGWPILGDQVYPELLPETAEDFSRPMHLVARQLDFVDPISGQPRRFITDRPH